MSAFFDKMYDAGFSDPDEYMDYLEQRGIDAIERSFYNSREYDYDEYDDYNGYEQGSEPPSFLIVKSRNGLITEAYMMGF